MMFRILIFITLVIINLHKAHASGLFEPSIIESNGSSVCQMVLAHYKRIFLSDLQTTETIKGSKDVYVPSFELKPAGEPNGNIKTAKIDIDGIEKLIVYYSRPLGWRGDIHTGYMIDPSQFSELEQQLKSEPTLPHFYPMGSLSYGSNFTWWENLPFRYENKWYVLGDFGDFDRHNSLREVYEISTKSVPAKVCSIKIFENFGPDSDGRKFPFFSAYINSLETIMLSNGDCGTSRPEAYAQASGQFYASMAIVRPWAAHTIWNKNHRDAHTAAFQREHFDDWKYQDIWSYREKETLSNLKRDAINELKAHYIKNFSFSEKDALGKANGIIESMPGRYYSLGVYYDQDKDFSVFQNIAEGTYKGWQNLPNQFKGKYETFPYSMLTLLIDIPENIKQLPDPIRPEAIITSYKKDLLMFAAHMNNYESVKYLIESEWPIDNVTELKDSFCGPNMERTHRSALTYAAENGSIHLIKLLVSAGADTEIKDSKGNSLDFYIKNNPRFSDEEKSLGFKQLLKKYENYNDIKPSFNCNQKLKHMEKLICTDKSLAIYDAELFGAYKKILLIDSITRSIKESQIQWIKERTEICTGFSDDVQIKACIARQTRARTRYLEYVANAFNNSMKHIASTSNEKIKQ